ncbi:uncharacterized protein IWZ02DRAFT_223582 [Phyllosticta citriasiana]|uniref:uncharacterized protein n=1 Tax=Phyllosticta citriasiana TaxID=595635 RepID=UPI0030FDCCA6
MPSAAALTDPWPIRRFGMWLCRSCTRHSRPPGTIVLYLTLLRSSALPSACAPLLACSSGLGASTVHNDSMCAAVSAAPMAPASLPSTEPLPPLRLTPTLSSLSHFSRPLSSDAQLELQPSIVLSSCAVPASPCQGLAAAQPMFCLVPTVAKTGHIRPRYRLA